MNKPIIADLVAHDDCVSIMRKKGFRVYEDLTGQGDLISVIHVRIRIESSRWSRVCTLSKIGDKWYTIDTKKYSPNLVLKDIIVFRDSTYDKILTSAVEHALAQERVEPTDSSRTIKWTRINIWPP